MLAGMVWFTTLAALLFGTLERPQAAAPTGALGAGALGIAATFFVSSVLEALTRSP